MINGTGKKKNIERVGKEVRNLGLEGGERVSLFNRVVQMGLNAEETYLGKEFLADGIANAKVLFVHFPSPVFLPQK